MTTNKTALITGASKGLGYYLAESLALQGWKLLINARNSKELLVAKKRIGPLTKVVAIAGDVTDEIHLLELAEALEANKWPLDLVVNNASKLGVTPLTSLGSSLKPLLKHPVESLHRIFHTNMIAPISLLQKVQPYLNTQAKIINVSSDAGVEAYENWGAYGGSKAGLDHLTAILGKENPQYFFYSFDPGDMRTDMHQAAFPNEDISNRSFPTEHAVPAMLQLIEGTLPSGRYTIHSFEKQPA